MNWSRSSGFSPSTLKIKSTTENLPKDLTSATQWKQTLIWPRRRSKAPCSNLSKAESHHSSSQFQWSNSQAICSHAHSKSIQKEPSSLMCSELTSTKTDTFHSKTWRPLSPKPNQKFFHKWMMFLLTTCSPDSENARLKRRSAFLMFSKPSMLTTMALSPEKIGATILTKSCSLPKSKKKACSTSWTESRIFKWSITKLSSHSSTIKSLPKLISTKSLTGSKMRFKKLKIGTKTQSLLSKIVSKWSTKMAIHTWMKKTL